MVTYLSYCIHFQVIIYYLLRNQNINIYVLIRNVIHPFYYIRDSFFRFGVLHHRAHTSCLSINMLGIPLLREDFKKKINGKENDIVQKGGVSEKYQIMNVLLKSDILLGEGGWSKPMSFFQNVFLLIICQFLSSSCYILSSIFSKIASFFPIFDTNSHFIIDCCVNGKV